MPSGSDANDAHARHHERDHEATPFRGIHRREPQKTGATEQQNEISGSAKMK